MPKNNILNVGFLTKRGFLNRYALSCGYMEEYSSEHGKALLDMPSPSCGFYRVRGKDDSDTATFHTLTAAREYAKNISGDRRSHRWG